MKVERSELLNFALLDIGKLPRHCRWCGKRIPPRNRYYCSEECAKRTYDTYIWERVRRLVLKRDEYKCRECGKPLAKENRYGMMQVTEAYEIHHIRTFLELLRDVGNGFKGSHDQYKRALMDAYFDKENLITLCLPCHGKQLHPRFVEKTDHLDDRENCITYRWSEYDAVKQDRMSLEGFGDFQKMILIPQQITLFAAMEV